MSFVYENCAAIIFAAVVGILAWVFGGTCDEKMLHVTPWIWLVLVETMLFFPQRHKGESLYEARERVWANLRGDPLTWVSVAFLVFLCIPFVNAGLCPSCDAWEIAAGASAEPPVGFLPFCVNRLHHLSVVLWYLPALSAMIAVRHALTKKGKRLFLEMIVWNGVALAVFGFVQQVMGAPGPLWGTLEDGKPSPYFFSTFGYSNMGGDYFTMMFGLAVAVWRWRVEEVAREEADLQKEGRSLGRQLFWRKHYMMIAIVITFIGAMSTLSRAAIMLTTTLAIVFFIHTAVMFLARMRKAARVRAGVYSMIVLILIALLASIFMPKELQKEVSTINTGEVLNRVTGKYDALSRQAMDLWRDHPIFGCGGWGFMHLQETKATEDDFKHGYVGGVGAANVHNDYIQILAEHGIVGLGCFILIVFLLLLPVATAWRTLSVTARFAQKKSERLPPPQSFFALPAPAFCIIMTAIATCVHAFGDCPLRSPAILTMFFVELATIEGFLPHISEHTDETEPEPQPHEHHHHHHHHHHHETQPLHSTGENNAESQS